jgi:hypothetical protein
MREVNIRFKDERVRLLFLRIPGQFAVYCKVERLAAVRALALDLDYQWFVT